MKRFDEKETYIDKLGFVIITYERNNKEINKEIINLKIGTIIQKTYYIMGDKKIYAGCKHMSEEEAINCINNSSENWRKKVND